MATDAFIDRRNPAWPVAGYWTAFVVNLFALSSSVALMMEGKGISGTPQAWIPWVVNLAIIVGSLWWFPGFAIGYLLGLVVSFAAALSFMPSCAGACQVGIAIGSEFGMLVFGLLMILFVLFWLAVGIAFSIYTYRQANKIRQPSPPAGQEGSAVGK